VAGSVASPLRVYVGRIEHMIRNCYRCIITRSWRQKNSSKSLQRIL